MNLRKHDTLVIRLFEDTDIPGIVQAFQQIGWNKPASQYERYLIEQKLGLRDVYLACVKEQFAGYLTICWISHYATFHRRNIPEIVDFNVLPSFRRQGIGTELMNKAEREIAKISPLAGIGVGMTSDYGAAQRLYALRGYVPDGLGLYYKDHHVRNDENIVINDDLALYLTKELK
jgi:GNAT superfamily N-acetyltransferase